MFNVLTLMALLAMPAQVQTTVQKDSLLGASASDSTAAVGDTECGIDYVQFYLDGNPIGPKITQAGPVNNYYFMWDSRTVPNGTHVLTALAADKAGLNGACDGTRPNTTLSAPITFTVNNIPDDVTPPTITINPPQSGALITTKQQPIHVAAMDESTIGQIVLKINGTTRATTYGQNTLDYLWNTNPYKGTAVRLDTTVTDMTGHIGTATSTVTVRK